MGIYKNIILVVLFSILTAAQAFALKADFGSVRKFHNDEVEQLLKDYTLEDSLTIRLELKRKNEELKNQKIVDIPGLYQKTGEVDDRGLESILNLYERRVVFIKKRQVSDKELDLVKQALIERLFLPKETTFTTLDNIPTLDNAVKNLKSDFLFGAYETLIKGGQFLWIIIFSAGFIFAMWFLAKVWKAKAAPAEGGAGAGAGSAGVGGGSSENLGNSENNIKADEFGFDKELDISSKSSKALETFNFESLCHNILDCYKVLPGSATFLLWKSFSDLYSQIQFYELIRIQEQLPSAVKDETFKVLDSVFDFKNRASKDSGARGGKGFSQESLSSLSIELIRQKFMAPNELYEKSIQAIYPKCADDIELLFEKSYSNHHIVLYKLYKDQFLNYISKIKSDDVMKKIDELIAFNPAVDHPKDEAYKSFIEHCSKLNLSEISINQSASINSKMLSMIYQMSETELVKIEALKTNESLKAQVPKFDWINTEDLKLFKDFLSNLSGPEMKYFLDFDPKYNETMKKLDERALFRFNERMKREAHLSLDWKSFRDKIKKTYKYNIVVGTNAQDKVAKAS